MAGKAVTARTDAEALERLNRRVAGREWSGPVETVWLLSVLSAVEARGASHVPADLTENWLVEGQQSAHNCQSWNLGDHPNPGMDHGQRMEAVDPPPLGDPEKLREP